MASWPTSLPQYALADSYDEQPRDITVRSNPDVGPEITRPRYTAYPVDVSFALLMTSAQIDILDTFYDATLNFGTTSFTWIQQRTLAAATYKFRQRPSYQPLGGGFWRVPLALTIWP